MLLRMPTAGLELQLARAQVRFIMAIVALVSSRTTRAWDRCLKRIWDVAIDFK